MVRKGKILVYFYEPEASSHDVELYQLRLVDLKVDIQTLGILDETVARSFALIFESTLQALLGSVWTNRGVQVQRSALDLPKTAWVYGNGHYFISERPLNLKVIETRAEREKRSLLCKICLADGGKSHKYSSVDTLNYHIYINHSDFTGHQCPHCEKIYKYKANMEPHVLIHEGKTGMYPCGEPGCNFACNTSRHLRYHQDRHLPEGERKYLHNVRTHKCGHSSCKDSQRMFLSKSQIEEHYSRAHATDDEKTFRCSTPGCSAAYTLKRMLNQHLTRCTFLRPPKPEVDRPFGCIYCSKRYGNKNSLQDHERAKHSEELAAERAARGGKRRPNKKPRPGPDASRLNCSYGNCDMTFKKVRERDRHVQNHHKDEWAAEYAAFEFSCPCGNRCRSKANMTTHKKKYPKANSDETEAPDENTKNDQSISVRPSTRTYCGHCDKTFRKSNDRDKHFQHWHNMLNWNLCVPSAQHGSISRRT